MGSRLRLVATTSDRDLAARAWADVCHEFRLVEHALTRFAPDSPLTILNRAAATGAFVSVPAVLRRALVLADRARRLTCGRFDPRIIGALERAGESAGIALPEPAERSTDGACLELRRDGWVRIGSPVDLGGLGKGLALRGAVRRLAGLSGLAGFLVDAGGDLAVSGVPPDGPAWRLGIEDPAVPGLAVVGLEASELCLATSSIAVRRWDGPAGPAHHLIDPSTGRPARSGLVAVSVAGQDPAWAEVWSKALLIAGSARVRELADRQGLAAWWVRDDERVGASAGARSLERFRLRAA